MLEEKVNEALADQGLLESDEGKLLDSGLIVLATPALAVPATGVVVARAAYAGYQAANG
ncbi:hypothetical protein G4Z16_06210 [Streptomyces bathyalis]|uniref:Uncharacterized protein n=1 Tax=Streptomyces bathyalis TaxID=2710756 RepID=A0A7T1WRE9_9ACTN|nr:hypothetical protein [Streptomyces bathyalis]QPP06057.1 hypothetical protein G4Z16_06210 [Streptomyces bathyalis]